MSYGKKVRAPIRPITLAFAVIIALIFSFSTVIRAENVAGGEREREMVYSEAVERMRQGFEKHEESIDLSDLSISPDNLGKLFSDATKDTPYLFFVSNNLSYSYRTGGCVVSVKPKYTMEKGEAEEAVEYCKAEVKKITAMLKNCSDDLERVVRAHDLIRDSFSYDTTLESNNVYTFLKTRKGTCQGYTWTYMAVLRELGIECRYVASDTIAHIWLTVKIDGEWYHSDATWDDPPSAEGSGQKSRAHLLFSDEKADADGYTDRYSASGEKCSDKRYDGEDFSPLFPSCSLRGDVDHDGDVGVRDILLLRIYIDKGIEGKGLCLVCADADPNFAIDEKDTETIRKNILLPG